MRSTPPRLVSVTLGAVLGAVLLSGCVRHYHHGSHPRTVVIEKPSRTVVVEKPSTTVVVQKPPRTVVVEKPSATVVVQKPPRTAGVEKKGPPPWAPAHGYRHKHEGVDLQFDSGLGVYIVLGHSGYYFHGTRFYRRTEGAWLASASLNGSWVTVGMKDVPGKLRARYAREDREKGNHPAKPRR